MMISFFLFFIFIIISVFFYLFSLFFRLIISAFSAYSASLGGTSNINLAPWGQYTGYHDYAISFCFSQFIFIFVLSRIYYQFNRSYYKNLLLKLYKYKPYIKSFTLFILYIIYLPVNLALFRLYYCESGLLSADPTVLCDDTWHIIIATICSVVTLPFTIGLPIYTHMIVRVSTTYSVDSCFFVFLFFFVTFVCYVIFHFLYF